MAESPNLQSLYLKICTQQSRMHGLRYGSGFLPQNLGMRLQSIAPVKILQAENI